MVLSEYALTHPGFRFQILATDISTTVLEKAELGIYSDRSGAAGAGRAQGASTSCAAASRARSGARGAGVAPPGRVSPPELHGRRLRHPEKADAIFCRNVIIYFDRPTQQRILEKLTQHLVPGGYLFVGHAETLHEHGSAAGRRWLRRSTGGSMAEPDELIAGDVRAAGRIAPGARAHDSAHRARLLCGSHVSAFRGWASARCAIPCCRDVPAQPRGGLSAAAGRRYVDFAIRDLAQQLDALGAAAARCRSSCSAAAMCCRSPMTAIAADRRQTELRGRAASA